MSESHSQKFEANRRKVLGDITLEEINLPFHFNFSMMGAY